MENTIEGSGKLKFKAPTMEYVVRDRLWQILGIIAVVAICFVYKTNFTWWWGEWWKDESYYSHGPIVPIATAFLIWFEWKRISGLKVEPSAWGLAVLIPSLLLEFVAYRGGIPSVAGLTFPAVLIGTSMLLFGKSITKVILVPLVFLWFMCVPPTQYLAIISFHLKMISTVLATAGLKLMGLDVVQSGAKILLPTTQVEVGEPCSGIRTLVMLIAFNSFYAWMCNGRAWARLCVVAWAIPLSVITNSFRILAIALAGEYVGEDFMQFVHHYGAYGIVAVMWVITTLPLAKVLRCKDFRSMPL